MSKTISLVLEAITPTLYMVIASSIIAIILGIPLGIALAVTRDDGLKPNKIMYCIMSWSVNILRSLPFIILMFLIYPLTKIIVGKTIGTTAAIVPLTISAAPFVARLVEGHIVDIDNGILEAAKSMGASKIHIIFKVLLPEAFPSIVNSMTITAINIVSYSAMAGIVGGGGLGDIANRYGYQRNQYDVLVLAVVMIIIIVQIFQFTGTSISKKINRK